MSINKAFYNQKRAHLQIMKLISQECSKVRAQLLVSILYQLVHQKITLPPTTLRSQSFAVENVKILNPFKILFYFLSLAPWIPTFSGIIRRYSPREPRKRKV